MKFYFTFPIDNSDCSDHEIFGYAFPVSIRWSLLVSSASTEAAFTLQTHPIDLSVGRNIRNNGITDCELGTESRPGMQRRIGSLPRARKIGIILHVMGAKESMNAQKQLKKKETTTVLCDITEPLCSSHTP